MKGYDIDKIVYDLEHKGLIGNKTWGKIDFLVRQGFLISGFFKKRDYRPVFKKVKNNG